MMKVVEDEGRGSDFTEWLDYVEISWVGLSNEPLYVSADAMAQQSKQDVILQVINRQGNVVGQLLPGRGLVLDGKMSSEFPPASIWKEPAPVND